MSQGKLVGGAIAFVAGLLGVAVGYVMRGKQDQKDIKKVNDENEELRAQLRSILEVFKKTIKEKDSALAHYRETITQLEWVIVKLIEAPPETLSALHERLRQLGLSTEQVDLLEGTLAPIYRGQK